MNFILLLAFVALSSASTLYGTQKEIRVNDDRIVVRVPGKIVVIDKPKDDEEGLHVFVKEQDRLIRKIKIDRNKRIVKEVFFSLENESTEKFSEEEQNKEITTSSSEEFTGKTTRSGCSDIEEIKSQMNCLVTIFKRYEGKIEETTFRQLLNDIKVAVDNNECHPVIYEVLKDLELQQSIHTASNPLWRLYRNVREPERGSWKLNYMTQGTTEDQQKQTNMFDSERENQLSQEQQVGRQIEWIQQLLKNRQDERDDTTDNLFKTQQTDCSQEAMTKQLTYHNNIREIQGQIFHHQLRVQQLQLQQQFLNQKRQQMKLQIEVGQQQGMPFTQMQGLHRVRRVLQKKEQELLELQNNIHITIQRLQEELTKQGERLQKCLEDERREDERSMTKMF